MEPLIAAYLIGDVTEFPDGRESDGEVVYTRSDHPHPNAVPDYFTDAEWAQIAGMQAGAELWGDAARDGGEGVETIRRLAGPFVLRNLDMAAEEWDERIAELSHGIDYYYDGEFNAVEDHLPPDSLERPSGDGAA